MRKRGHAGGGAHRRRRHRTPRFARPARLANILAGARIWRAPPRPPRPVRARRSKAKSNAHLNFPAAMPGRACPAQAEGALHRAEAGMWHLTALMEHVVFTREGHGFEGVLGGKGMTGKFHGKQSKTKRCFQNLEMIVSWSFSAIFRILHLLQLLEGLGKGATGAGHSRGVHWARPAHGGWGVAAPRACWRHMPR